MYKKAICIQSSKEFLPQAMHAIESAKRHNSDYKIVLLTDSEDTNLADYIVTKKDLNIEDDPYWLVNGRPSIVKYALKTLNFDFCIFIDGDTYTYNSYEELEKLLINGHSIIVTPHVLDPLPNDDKNPNMPGVCLAGNYNSGVFAASKKGLNFLEWWEYQTKVYPYVNAKSGIFAEQGWLRFAGDFDDNTKIFRNKGYNVAYWNIAERKISIKDGVYYCDNEKLTIMHFSGLTKETPPESMSIHQNRYMLNNKGIIYKIYDDYKKTVWKTEQTQKKFSQDWFSSN